MDDETNPTVIADRRAFFAYDAAAETISKAFTREIGKAANAFVASFMPPENVQSFAHGNGWQNPGAADARDSGMMAHTAEFATKYDDVIGHDIGMIDKAIANVANQLQSQFSQMFFDNVGSAAESVGNVVDAQGLPPEELYYRGLETVEVSANPDLTIRWPTVMGGGTDLSKRMDDAVAAADEAFKTRLEALKAQKAKVARERETARQARFARYGD